MRANGRPIEGLHQGLWQGKARGLDDDMVRERIKREKLLDRGQKIVGDGAADAAIGEFDDFLGAAGEIAAAVQDLRIDADIAEFVNDEGNAAAFGIFQEMANEGRLPRAKKAGDDRCRDFDRHYGRDFGKTIHEHAPGPLAVGGCFNWGSRTNPAPSPAGGSPPASVSGRVTPPAL